MNYVIFKNAEISKKQKTKKTTTFPKEQNFVKEKREFFEILKN
jgi:hypothetical protein